jgi:hypothetical protein
VCTSVALVSLLTLLPTLSAGYGGVGSAALTGLAQQVVRRCGTCGCDGAVGVPQSNACVVPHVSASASLPVQRPCSRSASTCTAADAIGDGAAACIPSAPLPITATDHQWALLGESLTDVLGPAPVTRLLGRYGRRQHDRARSGQGKSFGEPDATEEVLCLTAAWACVSVVSGVGLLVAGLHFSWLVCLALSLNYWCAAAWITKGMSLHVGLAFLAFAVVQRRSLWLFGEKGNCALAPLLSARFLLVSTSCSPVRGVGARTSTAALPLFNPAPLHHAAEKRKRVSPKSGRQSPPKDRRTGDATEVCDALRPPASACAPGAKALPDALGARARSSMPVGCHFDRCICCPLASQGPPGGAAAAAAETTSSRDGKRKAEVGGSPSVRFCFQCCGPW